MECGTKKTEKQYRIFKTFSPIVPVKLKFWALTYFRGLKDNLKQANQVNVIINNNNNNNNNISNNNNSNNSDNNINGP